MARDRQRSKARQRAARAAQDKSGKTPRSRAEENAPDETGLPATPEETGLDDATVEESGLTEAPHLDHQVGAVDEFELAEAGVPIPAPSDEDPEQMSEEDFAALEDDVEEFERSMERAPDELELPADLIAENKLGYASHAGDDVQHKPRKERGKLLTFLRGCIDELRRVQWPDRPHVFQATAVVLGFCLVAGGFLGLMDAIWQPLVKAIL